MDMKQIPAPGTSVVLHKGDVLELTLLLPEDERRAGGAWVRSTMGSAETRRREIIDRAELGRPVLNRDWHDIPMRKAGARRYVARLPLIEVGRFEAKTFFLPEHSSEPIWPPGNNVIVKVEPAEYCCNNTIYTAFVRQFGPNKKKLSDTGNRAKAVDALDAAGYAVIPPSGTFRDLIRELDFIIGKLRFRTIQLLPIHPVPTTYARMGRFGSPYAALDFMDVDPALAEFDQRTTPIDQFQELVDAIHARHARLFLDIPVNHTGWASKLQIEHPEWFVRDNDMRFVSPGAWGVTWADLSKLDYEKKRLWKYMAEVLLFWARRGVDGFRCDAGYMIPFQAWEYITAKVRSEYPDTLLLLEGLGGRIEVVEQLLIDANLNWAYSELFQNYDRPQVEACLPEAMRISRTKGLFIHYAETHDNNRLAARSHGHARLRTALSALCSHEGAFGITNGVEWFATDKVDVHGASPLNWGNNENQSDFIARLTAILDAHPAFHAGAESRLVQRADSNSIALARHAPEGERLLILANLGEGPERACWSHEDFPLEGEVLHDLISGRKVFPEQCDGMLMCSLQPWEALCLSPRASDVETVDELLRGPAVQSGRVELQRARAKALEVLALMDGNAEYAETDIEMNVKAMLNNPISFCSGAAGTGTRGQRTEDGERKKRRRQDAGGQADGDLSPAYSRVSIWKWPADMKRMVMIPPDHFLYVSSSHPFTAEILDGQHVLHHEKSICRSNGEHFALFLPFPEPGLLVKQTLSLTVFEPGNCRHAQSDLLFLPDLSNAPVRRAFSFEEAFERGIYALCINGRGGMAQARGAWGEICTQYDALLAGNLNPAYPVDRRIMFARCRAWMVYQGYSQAIDRTCLDSFSTAEDGCATWRFIVSAGQGKKVPLEFTLNMRAGENAIEISFHRDKALVNGDYMGNGRPVKLILRPDLEDRVNHGKTKAYLGAEAAWPGSVSHAGNQFLFSPSKERQLQMKIGKGSFVSEPEWIYSVSHAEDAERGFDGSSDLFSPGYFHFTLKGGESAVLRAEILSTDNSEPSSLDAFCTRGGGKRRKTELCLDEAMREAMRAFIVKRDSLKTVIAGYPWFLDWGRDTLICLRGIIAAGMLKEARSILRQFGRFESNGTLPNMMCGDNDANRDTSDAPLWYCVACADLARKEGNREFFKADCGGRTIKDVLLSIAGNYIRGTPNGVNMDEESGLIFSPAHFTWMDTNYPAGSPREGYPIEIQALWHSALELLASLEPKGQWRKLAERVRESIMVYYAGPAVTPGKDTGGWLCDCLHAGRGRGAKKAVGDDALRPNQLLAITLGAIRDHKLRASILSACEELLIPGAIRSLADRPVKFALPVERGGQLLNDPHRPYWGKYTGDEDTRRKPAYHNGTAWTWLYPSYSEALFMTYGEPARKTALSLLAGSTRLINAGCVGQVPEIADGDSPHTARGCGAQAWGATELFRVLAELG